MKQQARVVVIGGGIAGTSTLYHLAQRGWTDTLLLEMDELTSGSTWHAAGNVPTFSTSRNVLKLQHYSTELYANLSVDPNYPINYHQTGSIRLAQSRTRYREFQHVSAMARAMGIEYEMIDVAEMQRRHPYVEGHDLVGALWDPYDGDIDPSQLTQALASAARKAGASIERFTRVTTIARTASGEWELTTSKGTVTAEIVINAGGYRGAEVVALAGQFLPMVSLEHQYLVTESVPELEAQQAIVPLVRDPDDSYYLRQEKTGLILGPYEWQATARWQDGNIPDTFAYELYPDDLDRLEWYIEQACKRMPLLGSVGVQRVINGPIPYAPDGLPYVGPAFGLPNFYHCCGFTFGICQGGGAGKSMAEWVIDGKPEWDLWALDPRRYTEYANQQYAVDRAVEIYQNEYAMHFPHYEWPAGRPSLVTSVYERLADKGARFGARGGWERATWFPRDGDTVDAEESFDRGVWFAAVGEECRAVQEQAGLLDLGGFSRYEVKGVGAAHWLDSLIAGRLPRAGRVSLSYFCRDDGGLWSEMTLTRLADDHFQLITAAAAKWHDFEYLHERLPADAGFNLIDVTDQWATLVLAGPRSRDILSRLTNTSLDNTGFPWLSARTIRVEGIEALAIRVNYVGELGWELHVSPASHLALYDALMREGAPLGLRDFGLYAMDSLRLEKSYRAWKVELDHEYSPLRSGLSRFVTLDKPAFVGRDALLAEQRDGVPDQFVTLLLEANNTDAIYGCPIHSDGQVVGYTTSGGFGHRLGASVALGYLRTDLATAGTELEVEVLGERLKASVVAESPYDPDNLKPRM